MYHPWRALRNLGDEWTLVWAPLAGIVDKLGHTTWHDKTITLDPEQDQAQRRSTLTHELVHVERGPWPHGHEEREERIVDEVAARRLISLEALADGMVWAYDIDELATVLWVDAETVTARMATLTEAEGLEIQGRLDAAESCFPDEVYDDVAWSGAGLEWNTGIDEDDEEAS